MIKNFQQSKIYFKPKSTDYMKSNQKKCVRLSEPIIELIKIQ